jgi:hypothetical protein
MIQSNDRRTDPRCLDARDALARAILIIAEANGVTVEIERVMNLADRVVLDGTREEIEHVIDVLIGSTRITNNP